MTEVEKLRALLAEARDSVKASLAEDGITEPRRDYRRGLHDRIDAALAEMTTVTGRYPSHMVSQKTPASLADMAEVEEMVALYHLGLSERIRPNVEAAPWVIEAVKKIEGERDEARAEVEMLRGVGCQDNDKQGEQASGPCGACRKCAYQRGAEAMREAAAKFALVSAAIGHDAKQVAQNIRALPVPEDK